MVSNVDAEGIVSLELEELSPGASTSFNVTVRPKLFGVYESTRARIRYRNGQSLSPEETDGSSNNNNNDVEIKQGYSTSLGRIRIISLAEDIRNNEYFIKQWLVFAVLYGLPTIIPFTIWQKTRKERLESLAGGDRKGGKKRN